jgi:hypothetical protein
VLSGRGFLKKISLIDYGERRSKMDDLRIRYIRNGKGQKKGVLVAAVFPELKEICIGFSLCHKKDKWDFVKGEHVKHFGLCIAVDRAVKWMNNELSYDECCTGDWIGIQHKETISVIPTTIKKPLIKFVKKLKEKHPDYVFPKWADTLSTF